VTQVFQDDSPYGYKRYLNDGSGEVQLFVHVSAGVDANSCRALTVGQTLRATGISEQYATTFEVAPRRPSDIVPH
jgi:DNA/RNA endonuclease YhcR with UshA esterase domain